MKQPDYTGENRCTPCTLVNLFLLLILSSGSILVLVTQLSQQASLIGGFVVFLIGAVAIWLRGYLVPGTPELTKQYFPRSLLQRFGKAPQSTSTEKNVDIDVEEYLLDAGVVASDSTGEDLNLTETYAKRLQKELSDSENGVEASELGQLYGVDREEYTLNESQHRVVLLGEKTIIVEWPSKSAFLLDVANARVLAEFEPTWASLEPEVRAEIVGGLRLFMKECPDGSDAQLQSKTVESCCSTHEYVRLICAGNGDLLFKHQIE